ncbi:TonB-linked outer membrane protein, SusC/RagA family [Flavobacterium sp. CF108]|uniref:SusC/RagA family TonB-linked outer membrane protein n=1 Tax=unclassified Flavobacterium TaxID=196869 RepID=UPI0008D8AAFF|nr:MULTISPECIES: TonB-dependent receptor [unclassified Flavobacterium]SEO64347.1 TonB-linked outer membrane protein, SusC/RagA family [Flavobacterium sp. fv08]SHI06435.1 TonB-linked outer membrane protein, SusC/RagA family [Flavobacterium sp. CF108]
MFTDEQIKSFRWYLLVSFLLASIMMSAQERKVTGKVTSSEDLLGLPGANVYIKNSSVGATTDMDGNYTVFVSEKNAVLVFNFVGYQSVEIPVGNKTAINVSLKPDTKNLEEVIVVGYGTRKKSDITGSVSSVTAKELTAYPLLNAEQALQGRAAGVSVQSNNGGEPGAPVKIRVRGGTSINASGDALIVVDGFAGVSMPAPQDIASIEVLKDASATAIYGSRGSNGVIMVTTKKGKPGKPVIEFSNSTSIQTVNNKLDLLDADQFAAYRKSFTTHTQGPANTDWQDVIYRDGMISNTQLSFSGGSDTVKYYVSGTYFNQNGVVINSGIDRYTIVANLEADLSPKFKVGLNTFTSKQNKDGIVSQTGAGGTGAAGVIASAYRFMPDKGIYNEDGTYTTTAPIGDDIDNPYATAMENILETVSIVNRNNFFAQYKITKDLDFKTTLGLTDNNSQTGRFIPSTLIAGKNIKGEASVNNTRFSSFLTENYLTFKREIIEKGVLTVLGGYSYQKNKNESSYAASRGFLTNTNSYRNLGAGTVFLKPDSNLSETELISAFGRLNFDYDDKYLLTFTARRDGSSSFSKNYKYGTFPSGAIGWNIGKENFLKDNKTISNLKLRASYGATGNPSIGAYSTLSRFSEIYDVSGDVIVNAVQLTSLDNPNLKWETSYQQDYGIDLGLFDNRISITADYYKTITKDLLFNRPLPGVSGIASQLQNVGELENKGWELGINSKNFIGQDFTWNTSFNISSNKNKVLKLADNKDLLINSTPGHFLATESQILRVGEPVGSFFGFIYDGVIQQGETVLPGNFETTPGGEKFRDYNGDGKLDSQDKTIIGNPNPDFIFGLNNDFTYKNLDLNIFFQGSEGGQILNYTLMELASGNNNATTEVLDSWTPTNTDTNVPKNAARTKRVTSRFVYDGSYIRLKNISLGYSLDEKVVSKFGLSKLRFYISAQNLWTITDYPGTDPETSYLNDNNSRSNTNLGLDYGGYPNVRTFTMGLNVKF